MAAKKQPANPTVGPPYSRGMSPSELSEYVEDTSPGGGSVSWGDSSETIVYIMPWSKIYDATITLLGWSWVEKVSLKPGAPVPPAPASEEGRYFCRRILPLSHPWKPNLVCTSISAWTGLGPKGKQAALFAGKMKAKGFPCPPFYSKYEKVQFTANFTQVKYDLYPDPIVNGDESLRFVWKEQEPSANMITLDQGTMKYGEGPEGVYGNTFNAPGYAQAEVQQSLQIRWTCIPKDYVCNVSGFPIRLINALQKVNSNTFLGFKPGTLLMEPYKFEYYRMPLPDRDGNFHFWADITINLKYFDPPYGNLGTGTDNGVQVNTPTFQMTSGSKNLTLLSGNLSGIIVGSRIVDAQNFGIPAGSTVTAVDSTTNPQTITISNAATATGPNQLTITVTRTKFGHLTAPREPNQYYWIKNYLGQDRYEGYDFNLFFYPLTQAEAAS